MDNIFENAARIWCGATWGENEYAELCDSFTYNGGDAKMRISVSGDYVLFINGKQASCNQYADFEHYKVYDELDITDRLKPGENTVCILAWYFGKSGMRYSTPMPGVIYEIIADGEVVAVSSAAALSRKSRAYQSGGKKQISPQLGYSFCYDARREDGWLMGERVGFSPSYVLDKPKSFYKRPIERSVIGDLVKGVVTQADGRYIVDFGREIVGLPSISIVSPREQKINIAYGELLENGHVKRIIGGRDFSFDYIAAAGENAYTNYMLRIAGRYMEIECETPIDIVFAGVLPQNYPVKARNVALGGLDARIYEICMNTLRLCMMEHYVDCPWREQCLYAFDSRNQMRVGYVAFEGGNAEYARANLLLMSKDKREDGLLSICFPSESDLTIPSFSLYFVLAVKEYMEYSGDLSLGEEVFEKLGSILGVFTNNMKNGLICRFAGGNRWNFYDWSPYANIIPGEGESEPDFLLNSIAVIALNAYADICRMLSRENCFEGVALQLAARTREEYYNAETGTFFVSDADEEPTELANSLAVVSGIADGDAAEKICGLLAENALVPCSLSMKTFKYDAMLKVSREKYASCVLDEIRSTYKIMLDKGATTVWETAEGAEAFDNAGSLCHGWSAIPVYYYDLLKGNM